MTLLFIAAEQNALQLERRPEEAAKASPLDSLRQEAQSYWTPLLAGWLFAPRFPKPLTRGAAAAALVCDCAKTESGIRDCNMIHTGGWPTLSHHPSKRLELFLLPRILRAAASCEGWGFRFQRFATRPAALGPNAKFFAHHKNIATFEPLTSNLSLRNNSRPVSTSTVPFVFTRTAILPHSSCCLGRGEEKYETFQKISRPTLRPHHPAKSHLGSPHPRRTYPPSRARRPRTPSRRRRTPDRGR
jgi:hypothetical protein